MESNKWISATLSIARKQPCAFTQLPHSFLSLVALYSYSQCCCKPVQFDSLADILDVLVQFSVDGTIQLTVFTEGDDLSYRWKVNNYLQEGENTDTFTLPPISSAVAKVSVNVSNEIGFDFRTVRVQVQSETISTMTSTMKPVEVGRVIEGERRRV